MNNNRIRGCHPALDAGSPENTGGLRVKPAMTNRHVELRVGTELSSGLNDVFVKKFLSI